MFKHFLRDSAIYGLAAILGRLVGLLLLPVYTRLLVSADFGVVDLLVIMTSLINVTVALEVTQGIARVYADTEDESAKREYASTGLWFTIVMYSTFVVAGLSGARWFAAGLLNDADRTPVFMAGVVASATAGLVYFLLNQLRWSLKPKQYAATSVVQAFVTPAVSIVLVVMLRLGVMGVVLAQIAGNLAAIGLAFWWSRNRYGLVFRPERLREMLSFSLPLVPSGIGVFVALYIDRIAIKEMMTMDDLGRYGIAYRIAAVTGLLMTSVGGAWTPLVYSRYRDDTAAAEMARIFRYFVLAALAIILGLAMFSPELVMLVATAEYASAAGVVPIIGAATLLSRMYIFAPGLGIAKRTRIVAAINIFAAVENLLLNVILIPWIGLYGAAWATLISAGTQFSMYVWLGHKHYPIPYSGKQLISATAGMICIAVAFHFVDASVQWRPAAVLTMKTIGFALSVVALSAWLIGFKELKAAVAKYLCRRTDHMSTNITNIEN